MWTTESLREHRAEILALAARHGASNVRVFGSVARGEAREDSDVDLLVDMEQGRSLMARARLIVDLQDLLHCKVDVVPDKNLHPRICDMVRREASAI